MLLARKASVSFIDALIIYLACGAPFGVYHLMGLRGRRAVGTSLPAAILRLLAWPVYAGINLYDRRHRPENARKALFDVRTEDLRAEIETIAFADSPVSSVFTFREVFYRYAGLSEAVAAANKLQDSLRSIPVNKSDRETVAAACKARRNRERLILHQTEGRNDLIDLLAGLTIPGSHRSRVVELMTELANHVSDPTAIDELSSLEFFPSPDLTTPLPQKAARASIPTA